MEQRLTAVLAQKATRLGPRLADVGADGPERATGGSAHDAEQPVVGQLYDGWLLAGAGFEMAGEGDGERLLVRGEPTDLELRRLRVVVHVLKAHELDSR